MAPKLLDLFCGAGGAGMGYHCAGFAVTGVDIAPQPRYPFDFIQADALDYLAAHGHEYDVIHASPPCQRYTSLRRMHKIAASTERYGDYIAETREMLRKIGKPYVIENVPGSPLEGYMMLCGWTFGLRVYRHRWFETAPMLLAPPHVHHPETCPPSGRGKSEQYGIISITGNGGAPDLGMPYLEYARLAMGIDWMNRMEISEAIPPAYTEYIGRQLLEAVCTP